MTYDEDYDTCKQCGEEFELTVPHQRFCTDHCREMYKTKQANKRWLKRKGDEPDEAFLKMFNTCRG